VKKLAAVPSETTARSHVITTSASRFGGYGSVHIDMDDLSAAYILWEERLKGKPEEIK